MDILQTFRNEFQSIAYFFLSDGCAKSGPAVGRKRGGLAWEGEGPKGQKGPKGLKGLMADCLSTHAPALRAPHLTLEGDYDGAYGTYKTYGAHNHFRPSGPSGPFWPFAKVHGY